MIDIEDDAQAEFVFDTIDELQTLLRLKQALFNGKFMGNTENANLAFDSMRKAIDDIWRSITLPLSINESHHNA